MGGHSSTEEFARRFAAQGRTTPPPRCIRKPICLTGETGRSSPSVPRGVGAGEIVPMCALREKAEQTAPRLCPYCRTWGRKPVTLRCSRRTGETGKSSPIAPRSLLHGGGHSSTEEFARRFAAQGRSRIRPPHLRLHPDLRYGEGETRPPLCVRTPEKQKFPF